MIGYLPSIMRRILDIFRLNIHLGFVLIFENEGTIHYALICSLVEKYHKKHTYIRK